MSEALRDGLVVAGILAVSGGAWLFHPGAGLLLLGAALILIGVRAAKGVGADRGQSPGA